MSQICLTFTEFIEKRTNNYNIKISYMKYVLILYLFCIVKFTCIFTNLVKVCRTHLIVRFSLKDLEDFP